jgi:hypothetical protein
MAAIKTLTVHNPWAWAIIFGGKDTENRSWPTPYRGRLIIHAGQKTDRPAITWLNDHGIDVPVRALDRGVIIGMVDLVDCVQDSTSMWADHGAWHWVLKNPEPADFIVPTRGQLGVYPPPADWRDAFSSRQIT